MYIFCQLFAVLAVYRIQHLTTELVHLGKKSNFTLIKINSFSQSNLQILNALIFINIIKKVRLFWFLSFYLKGGFIQQFLSCHIGSL